MIQSIFKKIKAFTTNDRGVTMLEYGMIAALIAAVCILSITTLGTDINAQFNTIATAIGK